jgi:hypothetical protein
MKWLNSGTNEPKQVISVGKADPKEAMKEVSSEIIKLCTELGGKENKALMNLLKEFDPSGNPNKIKNTEKLNELYSKLKDMKETNNA